jgi:hypothetical protein
LYCVTESMYNESLCLIVYNLARSLSLCGAARTTPS